MKNQIVVVAALALSTGGALFADFSYEQTSKMTGGAMMSMMKVVGAFSKQAREPIRSAIYVKGDRMAQLTGDTNGQIIDLAKEAITEIDFKRKTYSVYTFAEMTEALKRLDEKNKQDINFTIKGSVKETGQTRQISGMNTKQVILTVEMEGKDEKSGQPAPAMTVTSDMWLAPQAAGYEEVKNFYMKMAQKLRWTPGGGFLSMGNSGIGKGMAGMYSEMSKIDGVPVLQITKIGGPAGQGGETPAGEPAPQAQAEPQEKPSVGGALGRLGGGRLGGFGGFGRRKKQEEPKEEPAAQPQQAQQQQASAGGAASLMEMTTELSNFSAAAVDDAKFAVPAGFKQVDSQTLKSMR